MIGAVACGVPLVADLHRMRTEPLLTPLGPAVAGVGDEAQEHRDRVLVAANRRVRPATAQVSGPLLDVAGVHCHGYDPMNRANRPTESARCFRVEAANSRLACCRSHPVSIAANMASAGSRCRTTPRSASTEARRTWNIYRPNSHHDPFIRRMNPSSDEGLLGERPVQTGGQAFRGLIGLTL